jgi:hypothetical protein
MRTRSNAALMASLLVKSMQTHSAAGGGVLLEILSNPTSLKRPASLLTSAEPMKPLLPVMMTVSAGGMQISIHPRIRYARPHLSVTLGH